jgi:histidinol phosphatase-like PHP family hydrolase
MKDRNRIAKMQPVPQDLHIHTTFSSGDIAVADKQTVEFIARLGHAEIVGISDHFDYLIDGAFDSYEKTVRSFNFYLGTEVDGGPWVDLAATFDFDYYIYHCRDKDNDYKGLEVLLSTGKPVIIAHPCWLGTGMNRIPSECLVEINNRYVWRCDWESIYKRIAHRFRFVMSSDAHQPHWLNQNIARFVARESGIQEYLVFNEEK